MNPFPVCEVLGNTADLLRFADGAAVLYGAISAPARPHASVIRASDVSVFGPDGSLLPGQVPAGGPSLLAVPIAQGPAYR